MFETLKIIHFFGLILGIGGGVANAVAGARLIGLPPETGPVIGGFRQSLGQVSTIGLILLWLSGLALLATRGGENLASDQMFQFKLAAVIVLTGFSIAANMTVMAAKKAGGPPDAKRMKYIGIGALIFGLLAMVLAAITFS